LPFEKLHVRAAELEAHCRLIRETCNPLSLDDWRAARDGKRTFPDPPVPLTFDDGDSSVSSGARPILERYRVPAVVFACSAPIATRSAFWYDALAEAEGESAVEAVKLAPADAWHAVVRRLTRAAVRDRTLNPMTPDEL